MLSPTTLSASVMMMIASLLLPHPSHGWDAIRIDDSKYYAQHQQASYGVIDPYTGQVMDRDSYMESDYSAPRMSYQNALSHDSYQPVLTYQLNNSVSLDVDPVTQRIDSKINLAGDDKARSFKMKVNTKQIKAIMVWRLN